MIGEDGFAGPEPRADLIRALTAADRQAAVNTQPKNTHKPLFVCDR